MASVATQCLLVPLLLALLATGSVLSQKSGNRKSSSRTTPVPKTQTQDDTDELTDECPEPNGYFADGFQCDKYYECIDGAITEKLCPDGMVFNDYNIQVEKCDLPFNIDCSTRSELQKPQPTLHCPRLNGYFAHEDEKICDKFYFCVDGKFNMIVCPDGLVYNERTGICTWPDEAKKAGCSSQGGALNASDSRNTSQLVLSDADDKLPEQVDTNLTRQIDKALLQQFEKMLPQHPLTASDLQVFVKEENNSDKKADENTDFETNKKLPKNILNKIYNKKLEEKEEKETVDKKKESKIGKKIEKQSEKKMLYNFDDKVPLESLKDFLLQFDQNIPRKTEGIKTWQQVMTRGKRYTVHESTEGSQDDGEEDENFEFKDQAELEKITEEGYGKDYEDGLWEDPSAAPSRESSSELPADYDSADYEDKRADEDISGSAEYASGSMEYSGETSADYEDSVEPSEENVSDGFSGKLSVGSIFGDRMLLDEHGFPIFDHSFEDTDLRRWSKRDTVLSEGTDYSQDYNSYSENEAMKSSHTSPKSVTVTTTVAPQLLTTTASTAAAENSTDTTAT